MGGGVGAVWEAGEALVVRVVAFNSAPELPRLRNLHRYRVAPPAPTNAAPVHHPPLQSAVRVLGFISNIFYELYCTLRVFYNKGLVAVIFMSQKFYGKF